MNSDNWKGETKFFKQLRTSGRNYLSTRMIFYSSKLKSEIALINRSEKLDYYFKNKLGGESHLEDVLILLCEYFEEVIDFLPQGMPKDEHGIVHPIEYENENKNIIKWTPDLAALIANDRKMEIWIFEVKPVTTLLKKSVRKKWENKISSARDFCEKRGWTFFLFTDLFKKHTWIFENLMSIRSRKPRYGSIKEETVLKHIQNDPGKKIFQYLEVISLSLSKEKIWSAILSLLWKRKLFIDHTKPFNRNSILLLDDKLKLIDWLNTYSIENYDHDYTLPLKDEREEKYEKISRVVIKMYNSGLSIRKITKELKFSEYQKLGIGLGKTQIHEMIKLSNFGKKKSVIKKNGRVQNSGRKKKFLFKVDPETAKPIFLDPFFGEAINLFESKAKVSETDVWRAYYTLTRTHYSNMGIVNYNSSIPELLKLLPSMASKYQFTRNLKDYSKQFENRVTMKREGPRKALKSHLDVHATTPHRTTIGETVEMDHSPGNIRILFKIAIKTGTKLFFARPEITLAVDRNSRVILGYALRWEAPSAETNHLVLRRMILGNISPLYMNKMAENASTASKIIRGFESMHSRGVIDDESYFGISQIINVDLKDLCEWFDNLRVIPRTMAMDNGTDFTSTAFANTATELKIDFHFRAVGGANQGGTVERIIGKINNSAMNSIVGTTKSSIEEKGDMDPDKLAILTFEEVEALLLIEILKHHVEPSVSLRNQTPRAIWDSQIAEGLTPFPQFDSKVEEISFLEELAYKSIPVVLNGKKKYPSYTKNQGVRIYNIYYNHIADPFFENDKSWSYVFKPGEVVKCRQSQDDIRFIYWNNNNTGRVVKVWATRLLIDDHEYSGERLKVLPPISRNQYKSSEGLFELQLQVFREKHQKDYENLTTIKYSTMIQLNDPKTRKRVEREVNKMRQKEEEAMERESYIETPIDIEKTKTKARKRGKKPTFDPKLLRGVN